MPSQQTVTRRITSFRKVGNTYRRDHEVHRLQLHDREKLAGGTARNRLSREAGDQAMEKREFPPGYFGLGGPKSRSVSWRRARDRLLSSTICR